MMKTLTITITALSLAACSSLGQTEINALQQTAINDARDAGKDLHLAFLQCYALPNMDKKNCQRDAGNSNRKYADAVTWDYILPFRYEAEKLGFTAYLNDHGKSCKTINDGPVFDTERKSYVVHCASGETYHMHFNSRENAWHLEK